MWSILKNKQVDDKNEPQVEDFAPNLESEQQVAQADGSWAKSISRMLSFNEPEPERPALLAESTGGVWHKFKLSYSVQQININYMVLIVLRLNLHTLNANK